MSRARQRGSGPGPIPARRSELPPPGSAVHMVGVAGAGMRGLALLLEGEGYRVSGCDRSDVGALEELATRGIRLVSGHDPGHVEGADLVIRTVAVPPEAPEPAAAREAGIPVLTRARALAALLDGRRTAGVAGVHGKTTITAMTGLACQAAGLDPLVAVGGRVPAWNGFARAGSGPAVVEADEYDRSFLHLDPSLALVSSVEAEHVESYPDLAALEEAFGRYAERARSRDGVLFCLDDPGARRLGRRLGSELSYGRSPGAAFRVEVLEAEGPRQRCRLATPGERVEFELAVPGLHNAQNAAGALAAALLLGAEAEAAARGLAEFRGVERRLQILADRDGIAVVDDYAHHPTEVAASLAALRGRYPDRRLVAVFQPHLFSRTRAFAGEFAEALSAADEAWVLPIYPAREAPIPGVTARLIAEAAEGLRECTAEEALARVGRDAEAEGEGVGTTGRAASPDEAGRGAGGGVTFAFMGAGDVTALARTAAEEVAGRVVGT